MFSLKNINSSVDIVRQFFFNNLWEKAEAIAGDRAEYVHRSSMQWRCIEILLHPNEEDALAFAAEIERLGIRWAEGNNNNIPVYQMDPFKALFPNLQAKPEEEQ